MDTIEVYQEEINPAPQDIDELLGTVRLLLKNVVCCWSDLLFASHLRPQIREAWQELDFDGMRAEVAEADDALREVGLSGAQLALKLAGLSEALQPFTRSPSVRKLLTVFDWVVAILGSLAGASRRIEQLKEFIEVLQKLIDWGEGQQQTP